jgi:hypothetical protein
VQPPHGDQRPRRRHRGQRDGSGIGVAPAQRDEEVTDIGLRHLLQVVDAAQRQMLGVAAQIAPVGAQGVGRDAALDGQVVEVTLQLVVQGRAEGADVGSTGDGGHQ